MPPSAGHLAIFLCQPTKVKNINDSCGKVLECVYFALSLLAAYFQHCLSCVLKFTVTVPKTFSHILHCGCSEWSPPCAISALWLQHCLFRERTDSVKQGLAGASQHFITMVASKCLICRNISLAIICSPTSMKNILFNS